MPLPDVAASHAAFFDAAVADRERATDNALGMFYSRAVEDKKATLATRIKQFKQVPYCKILIPGDRLNEHDQPARDKDKERFPAAWAKFEGGNEQPHLDGLPIERWGMIDIAQAAFLKYHNCFTVQQLAEMSDANISDLGGNVRTLSNQAKIFLETAKAADGEGPAYALQARIDNQADEIAILKEQVQGLQEALQQSKMISAPPATPAAVRPEA